jgi:UDP-N-acetylmuramyl pentapeptide phosphotransferase/UDP-N-acetylglucosamine-1-phosphate transferase
VPIPYVFATVGTRNALMVLDGLDGASVIWSQ